MSTLKKFAGQTAVYGLSTIISRLLNFILTPIYVGLYPAKVYGIFTSMYAWASMLNAVLAFGMETTFFRFINKNDNHRKVYSTTFFTIVFISLVFVILTSFFADDIAGWMYDSGVTSLSDYITFIKLFIWILAVDAVAVIPFAQVRAEGRPGRYSWIKLANIVVFVALNLFFLFAVPWLTRQGWASFSWYRPGWVGYVFVSNLIASLITLLLLLPELLRLTFSFDAPLVKEMLGYSFPVLVANLSFIVNENSDKIFIKQLLGGSYGEEQVGIYGAVCKIAIFLSIFVQAFRLGAEPFFFSHARQKKSGETYAQIMDYFVIAVSLIFLGIVANIELFKFFITGKDAQQQALYWSGLKVVPVLLLGYVSLGIYMNLSIWYKLSDQTRYGLYISGVGAILTILLNVLLIPKFSYVASAWISLTAYATMMILSYILGQKNYPIPYHLKKNLVYLVSAAALAFLSFSIFRRNLIAGNLILLVFSIATLLAERKNLLQILKKT